MTERGGGVEVIEVHVKTAAGTERFAARIARMLQPPLVLLLDGPLGAGKTTFARGFVRALAGGRDVVVQSPTFALARTYATTPPVHHLDLYRVDDASGLEELGLLDLLHDATAFSLVEWPKGVVVSVPTAHVGLSDVDGGRAIRVEIPNVSILPRATATQVRRTKTPRRRA